MVVARYKSRVGGGSGGWGGGKNYAVARGRGSTPITDGDRELLYLLSELYEQLDAEIGEHAFFGVTSKMMLLEMDRRDWVGYRGMPREKYGRLRGSDPVERSRRKKQRSHVTEWLRLMESRRLVEVDGMGGHSNREIGWAVTQAGFKERLAW